MTNKEIYIKLCQERQISIFSQPWWLDAVVGSNNWNIVSIIKNNRIIASLPYCTQKYARFFNGIFNPHLTQRTDIFIDYPKFTTNQERLSYEIETISEILQKLPSLDIVSLNLNYPHYTYLPFYWANYNVSIRISYVIQDLRDLNRVYQNFHPRTKRHIARTEKKFNINTTKDIKAFYNLNKSSFTRKNIKIPYSYGLLSSIDNECLKQGCRIILSANLDNVMIGAIYLVWDKTSMYYLTSGVDQRYISTGVISLLIWEAIKLAAKMNLSFDFEGSMNESIEPFFRSFNPEMKHYLNVTKYNNKILKFYREIL